MEELTVHSSIQSISHDMLKLLQKTCVLMLQQIFNDYQIDTEFTCDEIVSTLLQEKIEIPSLYYSHNRDVLTRDGVIYAKTDFINLKPDEQIENKEVRFRTIGDATCTGAVSSSANTIEKIISEVSSTRTTERGTRADDKRSEAAMEDRKKQGYF